MSSSNYVYEVPKNLAGLGQRYLAAVIDSAIAALLCYVGFKVTLCFDLTKLTQAYVCLLLMAPGFAYYLLRDGLAGGQSFGKRAMKIQVVSDVYHMNCSPVQSVVRNLTRVLAFADWLPLFFGSRKRLGDMLASTVVLKKI